MPYRAIVVLLLITAAIAWTPPGEDDAAIVKQRPSYPLDTCVVSGEALDAMGEPLEYMHEGRLVRLCCKGCVRKLNAEPEQFLATIDRAVVAAQKASYPLDTCVVSGEEIENPIELVHGTRLVRLCCPGCEKEFAKAPAAFMDKVDSALIAQQRASYPLDTCLVSDEPLGDKPMDRLHGTQLVRFCCKGCVREFDKDPMPTLVKLNAALTAARAKAERETAPERAASGDERSAGGAREGRGR